ncbi:hypothetical protein BKA93DRAFT_329747 [Sparassis latifolia]
MWSEADSKNWKRDGNELKSAKILLEEGCKNSSGLYTVQPVPIASPPGLTTIAFSLPNILRQWGGRIRELAMDSTCEFWVVLNERDILTPGQGILMVHDLNCSLY